MSRHLVPNSTNPIAFADDEDMLGIQLLVRPSTRQQRRYLEQQERRKSKKGALYGQLK